MSRTWNTFGVGGNATVNNVAGNTNIHHREPNKGGNQNQQRPKAYTSSISQPIINSVPDQRLGAQVPSDRAGSAPLVAAIEPMASDYSLLTRASYQPQASGDITYSSLPQPMPVGETPTGSTSSLQPSGTPPSGSNTSPVGATPTGSQASLQPSDTPTRGPDTSTGELPALTLPMIARDLRAENAMVAEDAAGYELAEEEHIKRILKTMENSKTRNDFARCQCTYIGKVSKCLPKVHLRLFVYQLARLMFHDKTDPRTVDAFDRQLTEWGSMDRATCIEREKEIEKVLNDFKPPSEDVRQDQRTMRRIASLDSEALEMQKTLAGQEGVLAGQRGDIDESRMNVCA
ncbi:hypothetical protein FIBSPDRAFT_935686 [Athelia psychrophila]|uniref:Uncharacterized protein n=1 Tax=Athelia psychrophila TaxID=1759441 RepID=A0A166DD06_9AGAM|nr:hypothetical protein FIBSPDRAFT_935686 [Fibularhizoctonia sp. CBS 109695]